jgi:hypothetical protein
MSVFIGRGEAADGRIRLGAVGFESKAVGVSKEEASIVTDLFTRTLAGSQSISIIEREQIDKIGAELRFNMSGLVDPSMAAEIGRVKGLQYMILGSVTELTEGTSATGAKGLVIGRREARATLDTRIVDVSTAEVVHTFVETGSASESTTGFSLGAILPVDFTHLETTFGGIKARAIADAVNRMAHGIRSEVGGEYSYVTSKSGGDVKIDVGSNLGAQPGHLYLVYLDGPNETHPVTGRVLGRNRLPLSVVKVTAVQSGFSTCDVADGASGKLIERGDKIIPISTAEAKSMVTNKKFLTKRPVRIPPDDIFNPQPPIDPGKTPNPPGPVPGTPDPDPAPPEPPSPAPPLPVGPGNMRDVPGVDPDNTTDSKLIEAYAFLSHIERNNLGIQHRGAYKLYSARRYKDAFEAFAKLTDDCPGNYLSAYWAGMSASKLRSYKEAIKWFDRALAVNPNYQPAIDGKARAEASGSRNNKKK